MMSSIVFASANEGKIREVTRFGEASGLKIVSPISLGKDLGPPPDVEETGSTFLENAQLKADAFMRWSGLAAIGDDSGLEVTALGGHPGLYTARYAGENASSEQNMEKLLRELSGVRDRSARYVSVLAFSPLEGNSLFARGYLYGSITESPRGKGGFGYDPIFEVGDTGKTLAELKEQVEVETHRIRSLKQLFEKIRGTIKE